MTIFKKQIGDKAKTILRNYNKYPQRNLIGFIIPRKILIKKKLIKIIGKSKVIAKILKIIE